MTVPHPDCPIKQPHIPHGMDTWGHRGQHCDGTDHDRRTLLELPWRTGMHVGRTIYAVPGEAPTKSDPLIGVMDSRELAALVVADHNRAILHDPPTKG